MNSSPERLARSLRSLEGLSVGDCFGQTFFVNPDVVDGLIEQRALAAGTWLYTDDTLMALSIVSVLRQFGRIDQDALAESFAARYEADRGYGPAMHRLLWKIRCGEDWLASAQGQFSGQGSFGNGGAMRVGPLGAYFAENLYEVVEQAALSTIVTHTHAEAIAGTIAVAVAAAYAWQLGQTGTLPTRAEFLDLILPWTPESQVRQGLVRARDLAPGTSVQFAVSTLGNGTQVSAQDTVPFSLWCAGESLDNFDEALWLTVSGLGDRDTTCAIVGGIVSLSTGNQNLPRELTASRERLPGWHLEETLSKPASSDSEGSNSSVLSTLRRRLIEPFLRQT